MTKNPHRVLSIAISICILLPLLWMIALFIHSLAFTQNLKSLNVIFFLLMISINILNFVADRKERIKIEYTRKKQVFSGVFYIVIGALLVVFDNILTSGMSWMLRLPFLLLSAAGALSIISVLIIPAKNEESKEPVPEGGGRKAWRL